MEIGQLSSTSLLNSTGLSFHQLSRHVEDLSLVSAVNLDPHQREAVK